MSERFLIEHCSPTLAGLKTANLFTAVFQSGEELVLELGELNRILSPFGLRVVPVGRKRGRVLLYLYRPEFLRRDMQDRRADELLRRCGYCGENVEELVMEMIRRVRAGDGFPHEIGLFLGYPPEDVQGFMEHPHSGCKLTGYWKVYGDAAQAEQVFAKYRRCIDCYRRNLEAGKTLQELIVRT